MKWCYISIVFLSSLNGYAMEQTTVTIDDTASAPTEEQLHKAISNYFKAYDSQLHSNLTEPLKRKIASMSHITCDHSSRDSRNSDDIEQLTHTLITDLLKEALHAKEESESDSESHGLRKSRHVLYTTVISSITAILTGAITAVTTYFASNNC